MSLDNQIIDHHRLYHGTRTCICVLFTRGHPRRVLPCAFPFEILGAIHSHLPFRVIVLEKHVLDSLCLFQPNPSSAKGLVKRKVMIFVQILISHGFGHEWRADTLTFHCFNNPPRQRLFSLRQTMLARQQTCHQSIVSANRNVLTVQVYGMNLPWEMLASQAYCSDYTNLLLNT